MRISCPKCRFEKDVDPKRIPSGEATCLCPKCGYRFKLQTGSNNVADVSHSIEESRPPTSEESPYSNGLISEKAALDADGSLIQDEPVTHITQSLPEQNTRLEPAAPGNAAGTMGKEGSGNRGPSEPSVTQGKRAETHKLSYHGNSFTLLKIYLINNLLAVLTLGVYHFWGKAKIRRFISSSTELMGERFAFTGTGKELFTGWCKASVIIFLAFVLPDILSDLVHPVFNLTVIPAAMVFMPFAMVASRRYRLSRTNWHGVRFSFAGSPKEFIKLHINGSLLTFLTLGFYSPYFHAKKEKFWRENTFYGTSSFNYTGVGSDLKGEYIKAFLLTIPTIGLYWFWYKASLMRYDWENTSFEGISFSSDLTGGRLLSFKLTNALLLMLTLGFAYPWILERSIKFTATHLTMKGDIDFSRLGQTRQDVGATGEGMAAIFDIDMAM